MGKYLALVLVLLSFKVFSQDKCNYLGAWLWYIEITGYTKHEDLAARLKAQKIKRIYVKVADGKVNTTTWPEIIDTKVVKAYKDKGLQVWAWSYNYPNNDSLQAEALYMAAKTGYQGFVVDVEMEFDGNFQKLNSLFKAFDAAKRRAIKDGHADSNFKLYVTTWGNPKDHNFKINAMDPFVDAYMPQTYVEQWGQTYMNNIPYWVEVGNQEYRELGATKPIHHIIATEKNLLTSSQINQFFEVSGGESSIWRIPGGSVSSAVWNVWEKVDWDRNFCATTVTDHVEELKVYPNPTSDIINISNEEKALELYNMYGQKIMSAFGTSMDISSLANGIYFLQVGQEIIKVIKY